MIVLGTVKKVDRAITDSAGSDLPGNNDPADERKTTRNTVRTAISDDIAELQLEEKKLAHDVQTIQDRQQFWQKRYTASTAQGKSPDLAAKELAAHWGERLKYAESKLERHRAEIESLTKKMQD